MIIYATRQMMKDYGLKAPEEMIDKSSAVIARKVADKEKDDALLKWAAKSFYFDGRMSVIFMNFATKLTVVCPDFAYEDTAYMGNALANYLFEIYRGHTGMRRLLEKFFDDHKIAAFDKLTDRSMISTLNNRVLADLANGERLYDYIKIDAKSGKSILHSIELNKDINWARPIVIEIDGKKEYPYPAEYFETLLCERYKVTADIKKK